MKNVAEDKKTLLEEDVVQQFFTRALEGLPYPYSQPPGDAEAATYVVFNEVGATAYTAGNDATRARHLVQLHAFTHSDNDEHRAAFFAALAKLRKAGVRVYSYGADEYEKDTGMHHIACTLTWWQQPGDTIDTPKEPAEPEESEE